jgi:hypothetical protein
MIYSDLPIYKSALDMSVYIETIVKSFDKYHKYTIGTDMRNMSKDILFLVHKANISKEKLLPLEKLRDKCEEFKMLLQIAKELKVFKSFKQFEHSSKLCIDICGQAQKWLDYFARVSK